jgi:hypothetical protein
MLFFSSMNTVIKSYFTGILNELPSRTKRSIFLVSLTARLKPQDKVDNEIFSKLNLAMKLSKHDSALKLPYELSRAIWRGKEPYEILGREEVVVSSEKARVENLITRIINAMPTWLQYAERSAIAKDVEELLANKSLGFSF